MSVQNQELIPPVAYSFASLAKATSINQNRLREDAKHNKLKGKRMGARWLFLPADVADYLANLPYA